MKLEDDLTATCSRKGSVGGQQTGDVRCDITVTHTPTGISATVGSERSQHRNRTLAIEMIKRALELIGIKYDE